MTAQAHHRSCSPRSRCSCCRCSLQQFGNAWVRIVDIALLYVLLALGLNIVVGYAGLLDLGYVAFFAIGAYMYALLASPHLTETFAWVKAACSRRAAHAALARDPAGALLAGLFGVLLGAPTLKLRGDYLAIVTLGFGEIIRVFLNNLDHPVNITNGPKGLDRDRLGAASSASNLGKSTRLFGDYELSVGHAVLLPVPGAGRGQRDHLPPAANSRASAAPGWRSARTRSPPRRWASTRAT